MSREGWTRIRIPKHWKGYRTYIFYFHSITCTCKSCLSSTVSVAAVQSRTSPKGSCQPLDRMTGMQPAYITCTLYLQELPLIHSECGGRPVKDLAKGEPYCLYLQELPLIHSERGGSPVQDLAKGELPTVGQDDRDAARLTQPRKLPAPLSRFPRRKNFFFNYTNYLTLCLKNLRIRGECIPELVVDPHHLKLNTDPHPH